MSDLLIFSLLTSQMSKLRQTNSCFPPCNTGWSGPGVGAGRGGGWKGEEQIGNRRTGKGTKDLGGGGVYIMIIERYQ